MSKNDWYRIIPFLDRILKLEPLGPMTPEGGKAKKKTLRPDKTEHITPVARVVRWLQKNGEQLLIVDQVGVLVQIDKFRQCFLSQLVQLQLCVQILFGFGFVN